MKKLNVELSCQTLFRLLYLQGTQVPVLDAACAEYFILERAINEAHRGNTQSITPYMDAIELFVILYCFCRQTGGGHREGLPIEMIDRILDFVEVGIWHARQLNNFLEIGGNHKEASQHMRKAIEIYTKHKNLEEYHRKLEKEVDFTPRLSR